MNIPSRRHLFSILILLTAVLCGRAIAKKIDITITPSVKYRFWWLSPDLSNVGQGQYVLLRLPRSKLKDLPVPPSEMMTSGNLQVTKRIGCDAGETIRRKGRDFYCNGQFIAHAKQFSLAGKPLLPADISGKIPAGMAFVVGDSPDSLDSRYFGLVSKSDFLEWAKPIF